MLLAAFLLCADARELRLKSIEDELPETEDFQHLDCRNLFSALKECHPDNDAQVAHCCRDTALFSKAGCFCDGMIMGFAADAPWLKNGRSVCAERGDLKIDEVDDSLCDNRLESVQTKCGVPKNKVDEERVKGIVNFGKIWRVSKDISWSIEHAFQHRLSSIANVSAGYVPGSEGLYLPAALLEANPAMKPMRDISPENVTKSDQYDNKITINYDIDDNKRMQLVLDYTPCSSDIESLFIIAKGLIDSKAPDVEVHDVAQHTPTIDEEPRYYPQNSVAPHLDDEASPDDILIEITGDVDRSDNNLMQTVKCAINSAMQSVESALPKSIAFWMHDAAAAVDSVLGQMFPNTQALLPESNQKAKKQESHLEVTIDFGSLKQEAGMGDATFRANTLPGGAVKVEYDMDIVTLVESTEPLELPEQKPSDNEDDIVADVNVEIELDDTGNGIELTLEIELDDAGFADAEDYADEEQERMMAADASMEGGARVYDDANGQDDGTDFDMTIDIQFEDEYDTDEEQERMMPADVNMLNAGQYNEFGVNGQDGSNDLELTFDIQFDDQDYADEEQERMMAADASMEGARPSDGNDKNGDVDFDLTIDIQIDDEDDADEEQERMMAADVNMLDASQYDEFGGNDQGEEIEVTVDIELREQDSDAGVDAREEAPQTSYTTENVEEQKESRVVEGNATSDVDDSQPVMSRVDEDDDAQAHKEGSWPWGEPAKQERQQTAEQQADIFHEIHTDEI